VNNDVTRDDKQIATSATVLAVLALVWNAIRWRRSQAAAVWALTLLAVAAAAATPWYALATQEALVRGRVAAAVPDQRVLSATYRPDRATQGRSVADIARAVDEALPGLPITGSIGQIAILGNVRAGTTTSAITLAARDDICAHSIVDGSCPDSPNEILVGRSMAGRQVGETLLFLAEDQKTQVMLTIVGHYRPADPQDVYWSGVFGGSLAPVDPVFTVPETITSLSGVRTRTVLDLPLAPQAYAQDLPERLDVAGDGLDAQGIVLRTGAVDLARLISDDRGHLADGLAVAAGRLVLLCGFALFLAVRHTATTGRRDLGLIRLRGVRRWRTWFVMVAPTVIPMLAGALLGAGVGLLGARLLAGSIAEPAHLRLALLGCAAAVVAVLAAAVAVAAVAQAQANRADVNDLLRSTPAAAQRKRAVDAVEVVVLVLAAVGVWQLIAVANSRIGTVAPAAAPALLALAAGLLVSRLLLRLATLAGSWALRVGRLPVALAALSACRRPALRWTVTLVVVAVAGLAGAVADSQRAQPALADRAVQELGAAEVLTVSAPSRILLRDAVRRVDPQGRYAMAVASYPRPAGLSTGLLAVDSARLGAVALWRGEYGPLPALAQPDPGSEADRTSITTGSLALTVDEDAQLHKDGRTGPFPDSGPPAPVSAGVWLLATVASQEGRTEVVRFGPLTPGRHVYAAAVAHCDSGCRLLSLTLVDRQVTLSGAVSDLPAEWGTRLRLESLRQNGKDVIGVDRFSDRLRWRGPTAPGALGPELSAGPAGLEITVPPECRSTDRGTCRPSVSPVNAPLPLPVVLAGPPYYGTRVQDARVGLLGTQDLPARVIDRVTVLPRLGGQGVLADLSDLDTLIGTQVEGEQLQVWLTADAPGSIVQGLSAAGVQTLGRKTLADLRAAYAGDAPAAVRRFSLLAAALGLVIAVVALLLSASAGRAATVGDLVALRAQGLPAPVVRRVGLAGYGWPAFAAIVVGLAVAGFSGGLPIPPPTIFADRWRLIEPPPGGVHWPVILVVFAVAGLVIFGAAGWATRRLTAAVRTRGGNGGLR
jgi:putative ABC transport system permease protein